MPSLVLSVACLAVALAGVAAGQPADPLDGGPATARPPAAGAGGPSPEDPVPQDLLTVAEASGFRRTAPHAEVVALVDRLVERWPLARRATLGTSVEGRELPLLVIADPPVATAQEAAAARAAGRPVVFAFANIHAGEVCGKEALLILARELLSAPHEYPHGEWLRSLVLVLAPIFNADGNERFGKDNRPGQDGPDEMGIRPNAQGLDLNRDYMKLESPEVQAMVAFLGAWDPQLVIDLHTTNGSLHRFDLTWAPPLNPAGPAAPLALVRDWLLPEVTARLWRRTRLVTFAYGNFEGGPDGKERWETYSALPRFGAQYHGLRGLPSILSEAYSKLPFERRVVATREFVAQILTWVSEHPTELLAAQAEGRAETIARGRVRGARDQVGIRHVLARAPDKLLLAGWKETTGEDGQPVSTGEPMDYLVEHWDRFEPAAFVERPLGYLVPAALAPLLEGLARHGIAFHAAAAASAPDGIEVEIYTLDELTSGGDAYLGHGTPDIQATPRRERMALGAGSDWIVVPTAQALGTLVVHLLEPEAEDALAPTLLGAGLTAGADYAVRRIVDAPDELLWPGA